MTNTTEVESWTNTMTKQRGAISTSHKLATEAGAAAFDAGGNAIDAALAAAAALCVVYPNNVALGGDLVALVRSPEGKVRFLNATGFGAGAETLESLRERHGSQLPLRGVDTITLPGGIRGWEALHNLGATRSWAQHLAAATKFAKEGVPLAKSVARALIDEQGDLSADPGSREVFYPGGKALAEGELFVQPSLARSLEELASEGADAFYTGALAERWTAGLQRLGSKLSLTDCAAFEVEWGEPLEGKSNGYRVLTSPPNTQGFSLLRALAAVEAKELQQPLGRDAGALAEAFRLSNTVRDSVLSDPNFGGLTGAELLAHSGQTDESNDTGVATGDTVGLSAISSDGWAVSLINSVYHGFGACVLEPETGIIFQNRGTSFSLDPDSPNAFAPHKRPRHTLMPVLVLQGNDVAWVPATMGGQAQPQIHAHLLLNVFTGVDVKSATHSPRWVVGRQDAGDGTTTVTVEEGVPAEAIASLSAAGFSVKGVDYPSERLGHSNLIAVTPDGYEAASDPRSDGSAIVVS